MVPSDRVDTIDVNTTTTTTTTTTNNNTNNSSGGNNSSNNCHPSGGGDGGGRGGNAHHSSVRFQDVPEPGDPRGPATKQECSKLVYTLSREVALYCCLSMGIGGVSDSYAFRDELRGTGSKVFDHVLLCKRRLMPLLLSKRLKEEEREDLERLYRIFFGCLEMLQAEFIRSMTLQSIFPLWDSTTQLIQTGISESMLHKKYCSTLEPLDASGLERQLADREEFNNLERKVATLQEMCYATSQMMDVNPWDYKPDTDHTKIDVETSDAEQEGSELADNHVNTGSPRHRKCIWIMVLVLGTLVVVAGVLGLAIALTKNDPPQD